jgi:Ca2+-binding RTX toxin-like protein
MLETYIDVPLGTTASQLQQLIDSASENTTFVLQSGTYFFDETVTISTDHVSLVGAGRGETIISVSADLGSAPAIQVGHELHHPEIENTYDLAVAASQGDTSIVAESGHDIQVGDFIYITQENTQEFFDEIGDTEWKKDKDLRTILVEVTEVDGDQITFDSPLTFDYDPSISTIQVRNMVEGNTLSGFSMVGPYGEANPGDFWNDKPGQGHTMIMLGGTVGAEVTNIGIEDGISHGITIAGSTDVTLDDFYMDGTHDKGGGGNGYAVWIRDVYDSSFTNLHIVDTRHAVVFGSYNTASGNDVHISYTNRDVNFHGGRDQFNTVVVDEMIRDETEQGYMAWATFINEGERYGAPTDPTTNTILIRTVVATSKGDEVYSHPDGSQMWGVGGADTIHSGQGDDYVNGGDSGDTIYASDGQDTINGGDSTDTLIFDGDFADYTVTRSGDDLYFTHVGGRTVVRNVEDFEFADGSYSDSNLLSSATNEVDPDTNPEPTPDFSGGPTVEGAGAIVGDPTEPVDTGGETSGSEGEESSETAPDEVAGSEIDWSPMPTDGLPVLGGGSGWQRLTTDQSFVMGPELEAMQFSNGGDYDVVGNSLENNMIANDSDNRLEGEGGDDRIFGKNGQDTLLGGDGNDYLDGGSGNDALYGGAGDDTLDGGNGDDVFLASSGQDEINGESDFDTVIFLDSISDYEILESGSGFTIANSLGQTTVVNVESFVFDGVAVTESDLMTAYAVAVEGTDTGGTDTGGTDTGGTDTGGTDTGGTDTGGTDTGGTDTGGTDTGGTDTGGTDTGGTDTGGTDTGGTDTGGTDTGGTDTGGTDTGGTDTGGTDTGGTDTGGTDTGGTDTGESGPITALSDIWLAADVTGLTVVEGETWWDRYSSDISFVMGADMDASEFGNENDLSVYGNALDNNMLGNTGANRMEGGIGDDRIFGRDGNDTLVGGAGNDTIKGDAGDDLLYGGVGDDSLNGGTGDDIFLTISGSDTIDGDGGNDTILFAETLSQYDIAVSSGAFVISNVTDSVVVRDTETFVFAGQEVAADDLLVTHAAAVVSDTGGTDTGGTDTGGTDTGGTDTGGTDTGGTDTGGTDTGGTDTGGTDTGGTDTGGTDTGGTDTGGTDTGESGPITALSDIWLAADVTGLTVVEGETWWDRYSSDISFVMGADMDASEFGNENDLSVYGNALDNNMLGNTGANRMEGGIGDDRIFGRDGNDTLIGGAGNDTLEGAEGDDALYGGIGDDSLSGGGGDDIFLTTSGSDTIDGDGGIDTILFVESLSQYDIELSSGAFVISNLTDSVMVRDTEIFVFSGQEVAADDLLETYVAVATSSEIWDL